MKRLKRLYSDLNKTAFWLTFAISVILISVSFVLPPTGTIDPSVLAATGELFGFATLGTVIQAIEKGGKSITLSKGETQINIQDTEQEQENN